MRVVRDLAQVHLTSRSFTSRVTVGVFDGVHRGHQQLVSAMVEAARSTVRPSLRPELRPGGAHARCEPRHEYSRWYSRQAGAHDTTIVLTFDPHPAVTLGYPSPPLLTTTEERAELLAALGLDVLVVLPFTPAIASTSATDFVELLVRHLHLAELWGGPDFAFGYRREGNVSFLQRLGAERGFTVRIVEPLVWDGSPVSSSRVRAALAAGDVDQATGCLGRPYRLAGVIVRGRGSGRRLDVRPLRGLAANLSPPPGRLIPAGGVYACLAHTERLGIYPAVVNVGARPTFAGQTPTVEAHLLDFACRGGSQRTGDIYDQALALDFVARLRDERPFPTHDALVTQIQNDIAQARGILSTQMP